MLEWIARTATHAAWATELPLLSSGLLVLSPEHYELLSRRWRTRRAFQEALWAACNSSLSPHVGAVVARVRYPEGGPRHCLARALVGGAVNCAALFGWSQTLVPKFESPECVHVVVAGGEAGKFSVFCPGFGAGFPGTPTHRMSVPCSVQVKPMAEVDPSTHVLFDAAAVEENAALGLVIYDPSGSHSSLGLPRGKASAIAIAPRASLDRAKVALLDISKGGSAAFLERASILLRRRFPGASTIGFTKPTFNRPSPDHLRRAIVASGCTHVVVALAD